MKKLFALALVLMGVLISLAALNQKQEMPVINYVPDEATAIKIADAIWVGIAGEEKVKSVRPFTAQLENGIWEVDGAPPKALGGTLHVRLQASDCKVLKVWGEK